MKRRGILAGGATVVRMAVTGVTTWLFTRESNGDEDGDQSTPESDQNKTPPGTGENETAPETSKEDVENQNQSEQPDAANPEPDSQGAEDKRICDQRECGGDNVRCSRGDWYSRGVSTQVDSAQVDNCEIWSFLTAVMVGTRRQAVSPTILYCHLHNCMMTLVGYLIDVKHGTPTFAVAG